MTLALNDRVKETTTVTGTGTATLLGATTGFQSFAVIGNANTTYYCIADQGGANWEVGIGTYTTSGTTLARTTVLASSNAGALVVFTTGVKDVFVTYPSEKGVWYDASGNVLFTGTTTAANLAYTGTLTGSTGILNIGSGQVYKDASGNVGIGTSSPGGDATNRSVTASGSGSASFNSSCGTVVSIYAATSSNGLLGTSSNHSLVFNTNNTERMRIDSSGNLLVGTTSVILNGKINSVFDQASASGIGLKNTSATATGYFCAFYNSAGALQGSIAQTSSTVTVYNVTSDKRLKIDKGVATNAPVIDNTIVHDFEWKADGVLDRGVFAQEAQLVKPSAVTKGKDDLNEEGVIVHPWAVDYSKYVPDLIVYCQQLNKQVQEQQTLIEALTSRLTKAGL